jgi:hypothetical protein
MIFFCIKSWFFTRNTPKISGSPFAWCIFFKCTPPNLKSWISHWVAYIADILKKICYGREIRKSLGYFVWKITILCKKKSYFFQLRRKARTFLRYFVWKITILHPMMLWKLVTQYFVLMNYRISINCHNISQQIWPGGHYQWWTFRFYCITIIKLLLLKFHKHRMSITEVKEFDDVILDFNLTTLCSQILKTSFENIPNDYDIRCLWNFSSNSLIIVIQ